MSHAARPRLAKRYPVLVTWRLRAGLPSSRADAEHALLRAAFAASTKEGFRVVEYSAQSNHVHILCEADDATELARGLTGLAVRIARGLNRLWRRAGKVLSDWYHSRILRTPSEVRSALVYVLQNARRHGAWIARVADVCSSGPQFDGWRGRGKVAVSSSVVLAPARTWLLERGWRQRGLMGLLELPKGAVRPMTARASA